MSWRRPSRPSNTADAAAGLLRVLLVAVVVLPVLVLGGGAWLAWQDQLAAGWQRVTRANDVAFEHALKVLEMHRLTLARVQELLGRADDEAIRADAPRLHQRLAAMVREMEQVQDIAIVDRNAVPMVDATAFPAPLLGHDDHAYVNDLRGGVAEPFISRLLRGRPERGRFFNIGMRRLDERGGFAGAVMVSMQPTYFEQYYLRTGLADLVAGGASAMLLRQDGTVLARQPQGDDSTLAAQLPPPVQRLLMQQPEGGTMRVRPRPDSPERLIVYRRLPGFGLYVLTSLPLSAVRHSWVAVLATHLYFGLPATCALVFITILALRRTRQAGAAALQVQQEAERRRLAEDAARQAQKLEALGKLTGGVAHDFNNLMAVIIGNAELARGKPPARVEDLLGRIVRAGERGVELTGKLLAFSRRRPLAPRVLDLNTELQRAYELVRASLRGDIACQLVAEPDLWPVKVDAGELDIALLNLAVNARDALPRGGTVLLHAENRHVLPGELPEAPELAGRFVVIGLEDNGVGMDSDVARHAFEPFFTTKDVGKGTGLGLSQVYGFAKQSGGEAMIESAPGRGCKVLIYLPRTEAAPEVLPSAPATTDFTARLNILLVEDNLEVADVTQRILVQLGHKVELCERARPALELLERHRRDFDLLLTDIVMPGGMSGLDLADAVEQRWPDLPIILTSGYSDAVPTTGVKFRLLRKPVSMADLRSALAAAMAGKQRTLA